MKQQKPKIKIHFNKIKQDKKSALYLMVDSFMIALVLINLAWMIVDWHFIGNFTREVIQSWFPSFFTWYDTNIHPNFLQYDTVFIAIFLIEIVIRWIIAIATKRYYKWWFYPFVHWYDVLGCIPVGSFRLLRLVRVYGIIIRLDRKGFIDIKHTGIYRLIKRNSDILVEEVSDKVVDNVLADMQEKVYANNELATKIIQDVVRPKQKELIKWMAIKVQLANKLFYDKFHQDIETYLKKNIALAVEHNEEIKKIDKIPLLGKQITDTLQKSISDITFSVIHNTLKDLAEQNREQELNQLTNIAFGVMLTNQKEDKRLEMVVKEIVVDSIDVIREQVAQKEWKTKERI